MSSAPEAASLWDELLRAALLGTERAPSPASTHSDAQLGGLLSQGKSQNREAALLATGALVAAYEHSGAIPESAGELSLPTAGQDVLPRCSSGAASYLRRILDGEFLFLLPEFLTALQNARKRIPEELLPLLLDAAKKDLHIRLAVAAVIGRRGEWLAALNSEWSFIGGEITAEQWETGTRAERLGLLRQLRRSTPEQAITVLESTWAQESAEDRAAFIAELEHGLSSKDETFLEAVLDDRRKEVRQRAAELLMRLPQSGLVERTWQRVSRLLRVGKSGGSKLKKLMGKQVLEIDLPEECDAAMQRDGIEIKPPLGMGKKAWWLQQMVSAIPPARWESHLGWSPEQCVSAFNDSEFHEALLPAAGAAALHHRNSRWAKAVVEASLKRAKQSKDILFPTSPAAGMIEAVRVMSEDDRDALLTKAFNDHRTKDEIEWALRLLRSCPPPWSVTLSKSLLNMLRHMCRRVSEGKGPPYWPAVGELDELARHISPSVAEEAQQGWPDDASQNNSFRSIEKMIEIITFRSKMLKEISR